MNGDTPDAVPTDDFPFLGPAVSPRRREAGFRSPEPGELAPPFVGGAFDAPPEAVEPVRDADEAPIDMAWLEAADEGHAGEIEEIGEGEPPAEVRWNETLGPAAEQDAGLESFPGGEVPADDLPWLSPSPSAPEIEPEEPWRATAEVDDLAVEPEPYVAGEESEVRHLSWIGEPIEAEERPAAQTGDEGGAGAAGEVFGVEAFSVEGVDQQRAEFEVDFEPAEEGWAGAEGWREVEDGQSAAGSEIVDARAEEFAVEAPGDELSAGADRWGEEGGFQVDEAEQEVDEAGEVVPGESRAEPVDAPALPVAEWETPAGETRVEADETEPAWAGAEGPEAGARDAGALGGPAGDDALGEVADRLERIAGALRSGRPLDGLEQGDPLQILITGYALGYSQARRGGR